MASQTEKADPLTFTILSVVGDTERASFLLRLLEGEATAKQLREPSSGGGRANKHLRRKLSQPTGARHLLRLVDVGLVAEGRKRKTQRLVHPQETRKFFEAANRLALAIGKARTSEDEDLAHDLESGEKSSGSSH